MIFILYSTLSKKIPNRETIATQICADCENCTMQIFSILQWDDQH